MKLIHKLSYNTIIILCIFFISPFVLEDVFSKDLNSYSMYGIRSGIIRSTLSGDNVSSEKEFKYSIGYLFGLSYSYKFFDTYKLSSNLLLINKGTTTSKDQDLNLTFISIPLKGYYNLFNSGLYIGGGLGINYLLSAETVDVNGIVTDNLDYLYRWDYTYCLGISFSIQLARDTDIIFEFTYEKGLKDITKPSIIYGNYNNRTRCINFAFGLDWS